MKTSISDYKEYKDVCSSSANNDELFANFRRHPHYIPILEHTSYDLGKGYIEWLLKKDFNLSQIEKIKLNDLQGGAILEQYGEPFGLICPSTLRYTKVMHELELMFESLDGKNIIEIGVGYGGQCKVINDIFKPASYTLVDLPEALALSKRYLRDSNFTNINYLTQDQLPTDKEYDLVISNYAFSECERLIQMGYVNDVLKKSESGYITFNTISHLFNIDSLSKEEFKTLMNCSEKGEEPASGANCIFYW
jgi:putative sugar O-methyltransferase